MSRFFLPLALLVFCILPVISHADSMRVWTSTSGTSIQAELVESDWDKVVLLRENGSELRIKMNQLSPADQDFLLKYIEEKNKGETGISEINAVAGKVRQNVRCGDDSRWGYHLYLPKKFHRGREWAVCFVMASGGGKSFKPMQKYLSAADRLGCVIALSIESKNGFADSDIAMAAMADDVFERIPVIEGMAFSSGMSGGSRMAYLLAERDKRIAGVLACGSGSGVYLKEKDFRDAKLRSSTYVYSLIGTNDFNRTGASKSHDGFSKECRLRFFKGFHDWAGAPLIEQGLSRVYGAALEGYNGIDSQMLELDYVKSVSALIKGLNEKAPWEAYYLSSYLDDQNLLTSELEVVHEILEKDERVHLALEAENDIRKFTKKYLVPVGFYVEDVQPNVRREVEANKLAGKYDSIPHGEMIRLLGKASRPPKKK
ncbi:hypothetical protein ACFPK9_15715 [Rubritalea spongiae]|uniref:SLA1 homology domain-containing protein n=1 Tax=Rubritalea spongiae TaxID=430797 RepID=A0ABW5DXK5_9BACT